MYNGQDRRKYKRIEKLYMVGIRAKQHESHETVSTGWDPVFLMDLSAGGAFFIYKKDLGIGTLLDLNIDVPESKLTINCVGEAIRIEQFQSASMFCTAIKFIDIGIQEKEIINTTVEELLDYKITHFQIKQ